MHARRQEEMIRQQLELGQEVVSVIEKFKGACKGASEDGLYQHSRCYNLKPLSFLPHSFSKYLQIDVPSWLKSEFEKLLQGLGFATYSVEVDWKYASKSTSTPTPTPSVRLQASWASPMEPAKKLLKGHEAPCAVCQETKSLIVLAPCGHVICRECKQRTTAQCPFCRQNVTCVTEGLFFS